MPICEYLCPDCGRMFEVLVKSISSGKSTAKCPSCGSSGASRQFSSFAVSAPAADVPACRETGACDSCHAAEGACPFSNN